MKVRDLISYLQDLDQDKNIFIVYDRYECQSPDIDVLSDKLLKYFKLPDYLADSPESDKPHVGDYFFDAY